MFNHLPMLIKPVITEFGSECKAVDSKAHALSMLQTLDQRFPIKIKCEPQIQSKYVILYFLVATLNKGKASDINPSICFI